MTRKRRKAKKNENSFSGDGEVVGVPGDIARMSRKELVAALKHFDLPTSGDVASLAARLKERIDSGLGVWVEGGTVQWAESSFHSSSGPEHFIRDECSPLEYFSLLWTDDIWEKILSSSNAYVDKFAGRKSAKRKQKDSPLITMGELKSYMGIRLHMGVFGAGRKRDFWTEAFLDGKDVIDKYCDVFSREKWEHLSRQIHFETVESADADDSLWKVRGLCDALNETFRRNWKPFQHLSIDEETIPTKARIKIKQYNPMKPSKWGIKVFALVDSQRYLYAFNLYAGADSKYGRGGSRLSRTSVKAWDGAEEDSPTKVYEHTIQLVKTLPPNIPYFLYVDNWYTSLALLRNLRDKNIRCSGTFKKLSGGLPSKVKEAKLKEKGEVFSMTLGSKFGAVKWMDTKEVLAATNWCDPSEMTKGKPLESSIFFVFFFLKIFLILASQ